MNQILFKEWEKKQTEIDNIIVGLKNSSTLETILAGELLDIKIREEYILAKKVMASIEEEENDPLTIEVNQVGLVSGTLKAENEEDADKIISTLIDAQNIPGVDTFEKAIVRRGKKIGWEE